MSQEAETISDRFLDESGGHCATDRLHSVSEGEHVIMEWGGGKSRAGGKSGVVSRKPSSAWGWAGCYFWGGLGGSAVLPDTTRCLSAFAQRLCHGWCWERCAGTAGAENTRRGCWLLPKPPRWRVGKEWVCFLLQFFDPSSL